MSTRVIVLQVKDTQTEDAIQMAIEIWNDNARLVSPDRVIETMVWTSFVAMEGDS